MGEAVREALVRKGEGPDEGKNWEVSRREG